MPKPTNFICTKCDFQGSSFPTWGSCSYLVDGKLIPVYREVAICYGCNSIVSVEVLPTQQRLDLFKNGNTNTMQLIYKEELQRFEALKDRATPVRHG